MVHGEAKVTPAYPTVLPTREMELVWGWLALFCAIGVESPSVCTVTACYGAWGMATVVPCHRHIGTREGDEVDYNREVAVGERMDGRDANDGNAGEQRGG